MALKIEKVIITDKTDPKCKEILESGGIAVDVKLKLSKEELLKEIPVSKECRELTKHMCPRRPAVA